MSRLQGSVYRSPVHIGTVFRALSDKIKDLYNKTRDGHGKLRFISSFRSISNQYVKWKNKKVF